MSLFSPVELAPRDPILGLNEAFNADTRANKVNLGVGVYCNEAGKVPLLRAVREKGSKNLTVVSSNVGTFAFAQTALIADRVARWSLIAAPPKAKPAAAKTTNSMAEADWASVRTVELSLFCDLGRPRRPEVCEGTTSGVKGEVVAADRRSLPLQRASGATSGVRGEVVAVGPGAKNEEGKIAPMDVKIGDIVLFGKWSGTEVKIDGKEYSIMKESDIMGISKSKK